MTIKTHRTLLLLAASIILAGCQTTETIPQYENIRTMQADSDLDGDGVLDAIDECPETPPNVVVDAKGCPVVVYTGSLEMQLQGFFEPMSSQLTDEYDQALAIIEENLHEQPDAKVFIFGHVASNELAMIAPDENNLSRNRAINVRNRLVEKHHITSDRISTYDCSDRYPFIATDFSESDLSGIESKDRRVTVKASTQVKDLANIENPSDWKNYEPYLKRCEIFKSE
ncbi:MULTISPECIES: OmpA family protein [unclassified Psychrobacter]|uniref:OmpA family protein n=1 Tax=unclassified Psychrobacter TaxID=196806 RepID=UPI003F475CF0